MSILNYLRKPSKRSTLRKPSLQSASRRLQTDPLRRRLSEISSSNLFSRSTAFHCLICGAIHLKGDSRIQLCQRASESLSLLGWLPVHPLSANTVELSDRLHRMAISGVSFSSQELVELGVMQGGSSSRKI